MVTLSVLLRLAISLPKIGCVGCLLAEAEHFVSHPGLDLDFGYVHVHEFDAFLESLSFGLAS